MTTSKDFMSVVFYNYKYKKGKYNIEKSLTLLIDKKQFFNAIDLIVYSYKVLKLDELLEFLLSKTVYKNSKYIIDSVLNSLLEIKEYPILKDCKIIEQITNEHVDKNNFIDNTIKVKEYLLSNMLIDLKSYIDPEDTIERKKITTFMESKEKIFYSYLYNKDYFYYAYELTKKNIEKLNKTNYIDFLLFLVLHKDSYAFFSNRDIIMSCILKFKDGTISLLVGNHVLIYEDELKLVQYDTILAKGIIKEIKLVDEYITSLTTKGGDKGSVYQLAKEIAKRN